MRRTPGALALYALVTTFLVGATTAFVGLDKEVTLSVDGETRTVHTFAGDVAGVLSRADVETGPRDLVVPSPDHPLAHDAKVVVRHARRLTLTVDGKSRTAWVTAATVQEALEQLRLDTRGAALSASRSRPIPRSGLSLRVRLPRQITIVIGDARLRMSTAAPTVQAALAEAGIELGPHDKTNAELDARPRDGQEIRIMQLAGEPETRTVAIPYDTVRKANPDMYDGEEKVVREGRVGLETIVTAVLIEKGHKVEKVIAHVVKRKPVDEVVEYGTKEREVPDVADLNWAALAECESGGNPDSVNPAGPYYGLYQFSASTWHSAGGEGVPTDASASEQTYRAQLLYQRSGAGQWPVCGSKLFS